MTHAYRKERSVVRNDDDVSGRARATRDEERVLRGGRTMNRDEVVQIHVAGWALYV